jgi:hypothetical protein
MGFLISLDKLTLRILFRKFPAEIMGYDFSLSLFLRLSSPFFFGFSLDMVLFVVSLHIRKFLWLLFRIRPAKNETKQSPVMKYEASSLPSRLCVF